MACSFPDCDRPNYGRQDVCSAHYHQRRTRGVLTPIRSRVGRGYPGGTQQPNTFSLLEAEIRRRVQRGIIHPQVLNAALETLLATSKDDLFISTEAQVENVRRWNTAFRWGFTLADFQSLQQPPECTGEGLVTTILVPYLDTPAETFSELWKVGSGWYFRGRRGFESSHIEPLANRLVVISDVDSTRGLRWEVIDLGANRTERAIQPVPEVEKHVRPHASVLAAAAHFPRWIQAMNGTDTPFVVIPGYLEPCYIHRMPYPCFLGLRGGRGGVLRTDFLCVDRIGWDSYGKKFAVPTLVQHG